MTLEEFLAHWNDASPCMEVKTSGSTGVPKRIYIEKVRMRASARMTCNFLNLHKGDTALLCMPLDFIAGKMMVVRALERGLELLSVEPSSHPLSKASMAGIGNPPCIDFAAMVPLQVWNTLQVPEERKTLCRIRHLIIGGGAISQSLEQELRKLPINVWSSYGMTETLSHIALRRITEECYTPLPGITVSQDQDGCLIINAPHLCPERLFTNDIARFTDDKSFQIIGRRDNIICSGGIKIQIEEVEAWLHSIGYDDVMVTYQDDTALGQALVYLTTTAVNTENLRQHLPDHTPSAKYWLPKRVIKVASLPITPTGKPDRARARRLTGSEERMSGER